MSRAQRAIKTGHTQIRLCAGALGDKEQVQLNALQQTANLTSSIVDVEEAKTGVELVVQKMRQLGRGIASALFD